MRPGGLLLNGDRIAYPAALPAFCGLADRERERLRQAAFIEQGGEDYRQWWAAIEQGRHTDAPRFSRSSTPTAQASSQATNAGGSAQPFQAELTKIASNWSRSMLPGAAFSSWSYTSTQPFSLRTLRQIVLELPEAIFRAKGLIYLAEAPQRRATLQAVGTRVNVTLGEPWGEEPPPTRSSGRWPGSLPRCTASTPGSTRASTWPRAGNPCSTSTSRAPIAPPAPSGCCLVSGPTRAMRRR